MSTGKIPQLTDSAPEWDTNLRMENCFSMRYVNSKDAQMYLHIKMSTKGTFSIVCLGWGVYTICYSFMAPMFSSSKDYFLKFVRVPEPLI